MKIMCIPDQETRLQALQRYLARSGTAVGSGAGDEDLPPDPRLATYAYTKQVSFNAATSKCMPIANAVIAFTHFYAYDLDL